jgi:hypothetical protein
MLAQTGEFIDAAHTVVAEHQGSRLQGRRKRRRRSRVS